MIYSGLFRRLRVIPCRAGITQFRSDWSAIWLYNPRMAASRHGFDEPGELQDIRLVVDTIPTLAWSAGPDGSTDFVNQRWLDYTGLSPEQALGLGWEVAIHPDDLPRILETFRQALNSVKPYEVEGRFRRFDGEFRWFLFRGSPLRDRSGNVAKWYGTSIDLEERKRAEDALRASEAFLLDAQRLTRTCSWKHEILSGKVTVSAEGLAMFGIEPGDDASSVDFYWKRHHPEDRLKVEQAYAAALIGKTDFKADFRLVLPDGTIKNTRSIGHPILDERGDVVEFVGASIDVTEQHEARAALQTAFEKLKAEETELRRSEADLHEAQRISRTGSWKLNLLTGRVTVSPEVFRRYAVNPDEDTSSPEFWFNRIHPDDRQRVRANLERCLAERANYEDNYRIILPDGTVKYQHSIGHPILNESGELVEFLGTTIEITEQVEARIKLEKAFEEIKNLKDRLHDENLALKEEIDRAFMFEEIVGASPALQTVLSSIVKVAPTDSTVLITGETGTGKELIARAIHRRSQRSSQAFISVNCASIPSSLIASELFGHEKGAFTGAVQRRQGRFEMAHSGTIFLDEVGELPAETQIALLRVLQERQFERVGGNRIIPTDVRVIAATNRDLTAAIAAGKFRTDLFYRLNVFPIEVPPLRKRKEDIPMLVEYFVKRYAEKAGKQIRKIDRNSLELCQSYPWPGNIRELQNIVERSVILSSGDTFWIDKAWLASVQPPRQELAGPLPDTLQNQEREMIETALAESKGKVAGPKGAAAKLGIPRSTLDWKIKQLRIKKHRFISE
jgi:PAS domain S-box-containing protein